MSSHSKNGGQNPQPGDNPIIIVQGAQWGSEAKGMVCDALGHQRDIDIMVRTGTVNAGHTVYYRGLPYKMQQLPVGWTNPETILYLGPGAYIHPEILAREITDIQKATGEDIRKRLYVDYRCGLHLPSHTAKATAAGRHHKMGATGKGCSEAVVDKIAGRGTDRGVLFKQWLDRARPEKEYESADILLGLNFEDVPHMLNDSWDNGAKVLIEGTQGTLLDLHTGPYPYTTHKQTACGNWIAEAGLSPNLPYEVVSVARSYPIRVAGNSGPMRYELDWPQLARRINRRLQHRGLAERVKEDSIVQFEEACHEVATTWLKAGRLRVEGPMRNITAIHLWTPTAREDHQEYVSELHKQALDLLPGPVVEDLKRLFEMTTVTNKLRRIAELDLEGLQYSCMLNRPSYLVLTFANYLFPELWNAEAGADTWADPAYAQTIKELHHNCKIITEHTGCPVAYVTTGPQCEHFISVSDDVGHGNRGSRATASAGPAGQTL